MRAIIIVFLVAFGVILAACSKPAPVCAKPYMVLGNTCCLDANGNGICDSDETANTTAPAAGGALDCKLCPPQFVTQKEEVPVYKYICMNATIVNTPEGCGIISVSNAALFKPNTQQDAAYIKSFSVRPACRGSVNAAELHIALNQRPLNITIQSLDDPAGSFMSIGSVKGVDDVYYYVGFCTDDCSKLTDAQLKPGKAYLLRAALQYDDKWIYTREFVVDDAGGDFEKKVC